MKTLWLIAALSTCEITIGKHVLGIPTIPFQTAGSKAYNVFKDIASVVVDARYANATDIHGSTLIPPTLYQFGELFANDLSDVFHRKISVVATYQPPPKSIFLTVDANGNFSNAASRWTSEGYSLNVSTLGLAVTGASPLGAWWGTRSILQLVSLRNGTLPYGYGTDSPGWATRGVMVRMRVHILL
jgi:hexosaminidase